MPEKETLERAEQDKREGKSPSTQAGEFVHEEIEHVREGKCSLEKSTLASGAKRRSQTLGGRAVSISKEGRQNAQEIISRVARLRVCSAPLTNQQPAVRTASLSKTNSEPGAVATGFK